MLIRESSIQFFTVVHSWMLDTRENAINLPIEISPRKCVFFEYQIILLHKEKAKCLFSEIFVKQFHHGAQFASFIYLFFSPSCEQLFCDTVG